MIKVAASARAGGETDCEQGECRLGECVGSGCCDSAGDAASCANAATAAQ